MDPSVVVSSTGEGSLKLSNISNDSSALLEASRATLERTQTMIVRQVNKSKAARYKEAVRFSSENAVLTKYDSSYIRYR